MFTPVQQHPAHSGIAMALGAQVKLGWPGVVTALAGVQKKVARVVGLGQPQPALGAFQHGGAVRRHLQRLYGGGGRQGAELPRRRGVGAGRAGIAVAVQRRGDQSVEGVHAATVARQARRQQRQRSAKCTGTALALRPAVLYGMGGICTG